MYTEKVSKSASWPNNNKAKSGCNCAQLGWHMDTVTKEMDDAGYSGFNPYRARFILGNLGSDLYLVTPEYSDLRARGVK